MRKILVLSLAIIILLGITSNGTFSYFSSPKNSTGNIFTAWVEEGCTCSMFNVSNNKGNPDNIFKYDASGALVGSPFDLSATNTSSQGVASTDDYIYVLDLADKQVYRYSCCGIPQGVSRGLKPKVGTKSIANPIGLAIDGNEMWVVSANDKMIYLYSLSAAFDGTGVPLPAAREIPLVDANTGAAGLAIDSTYLYVVDYDNPSKETRFYQYNRITGACGIGDISKVLLDGGGIALQSPAGAMFYGTSLWVVDSGTNKVYRYDNVASLFTDVSNPANANWEFPLHADNGDASGM